MKVINESDMVIDNELLPQILRRIFSVCREDPNFHMQDKIENIEIKMIKFFDRWA